jgi:hypothetical protein
MRSEARTCLAMLLRRLSRIEVTGLTRDSEYRFHVSAVGGGRLGPWSDQATRVANI